MTPYKQRLNPFIRRMAEDMQLRNLSQSTIDAYTYHVDKFCCYFGKPAEQLGLEEIRQYQLYLVNEKKVFWSSFNLSGMMHLSVNLLWGKELADLDRRLADDWGSSSMPSPLPARMASPSRSPRSPMASRDLPVPPVICRIVRDASHSWH